MTRAFHSQVPGDRRSATSVRLHDRFTVLRTLRHGMYLATDEHTGQKVIIKRARSSGTSRFEDTGDQEALRHEAHVLQLLASSGIVPRMVSIFHQHGSMFLVREFLPGSNLQVWSETRATRFPGRGLPPDEAVAMARQLVDLFVVAHAHCLALRDATPASMVVLPDGRLRLIHLKGAIETEKPARQDGSSARQIPGLDGRAQEQRANLITLAATIFYTVTAIPHPRVLEPHHEQALPATFTDLVTLIAPTHPGLYRLAPLLLGLTAPDPEQSWTLDQAAAFLTAPAHDQTSAGARSQDPQERLLTDGLTYLLRHLDPAKPYWPWQQNTPGQGGHPCDVYDGAAGVLPVLVRAASATGRAELRKAVADVARWVIEQTPTTHPLPGLHCGHAGTTCALHDAGHYLGDRTLSDRAVQLAKRLPTKSTQLDITHGLAGTGVAQLYLWLATGDPELRAHALRCAERLQENAQWLGKPAVWLQGVDQDEAPLFGFAHGIAGIGSFLLTVCDATDQREYAPTIQAVADTLSRSARIDDGAAWWPRASDRSRRNPNWCNGSAGIGTFLLHAWKSTGEQTYLDLAEQAARAAVRYKWRYPISVCCGLAGIGEFLLDLAEATGKTGYRHAAEDTAALLHTHRTLRDGLIVIDTYGPPGFEYGRFGYNLGMSGVLGFLLRLRFGGASWWMINPNAWQSGERPRAVSSSQMQGRVRK